MGTAVEVLRRKATLRMVRSRAFAQRGMGIELEAAAEEWRAHKERLLMEQPKQTYCDFLG